MENPISYSDLFSPDIQQGIEGLVSDIMRVEKQLKGMLESVKSEAQSLGEALAGVSSATKGGRDTTKADSDQVAKLYQAYMSLGEAYKYVEYNLSSLQKSQDRVNKAIKLGQTAANEDEGLIERLKAQIELAKMAYESMDKQTRDNTSDGKRLLTVIQSLTGQVKNYEKAMNGAATAETRMSTAHKQAKVETLDLGKSYSTLSGLITQTGVNLQSLVTSQKAQEQASKNGVIANNSLNGSYNQLYAQYNLIKIALNNMSKEMRDNVNVGKVWEAEALRIMNEMKAMQEATGKSTLSVGDYGKAFNGLRLSTQQVLREMPTLANSMQQFFIAISNNVPILVDNFKRASEELGGFTKALKATWTAIWNWQTALLIILTILPRVAKAIHDKRKAQEEANKETEKAITLEEMLAKVNVDVEKAISGSSVKIGFLTAVLEDNTRSIEDRASAARVLKGEFEDELANFTEEAIVAGEAKDALDKLTQSIKVQAEARAMLNKMVEYYGKILDNEANIAEAQSAYEVAVAQREAAETTEARIMGMSNLGEAYGKYAEQTEKARQAEAKALETLNAAKGETEKFKAVIEDLYNRLPIEGLAEKSEKAARRVRSAIEKALDIPSYYFELLQSIVNLTEDELDRELAQFDLNNEILKAKREEQMDELVDLEEELQKRIGETKDKNKKKEYEAELAFVQGEIKNLHQIQLNEELAFETARTKLVQEHAEKRLEIKRKNVQTEQQIAKANRDKLAYEEYEAGMNALDKTKDNTAKEIELKNALNKALLDSEKQYWEDYLKQLRDEGLLTVEAYNNIMDKIAGFNNAKPTSQATPNRKKRGSKQFRNVTELVFAMSNTFGEDILDENGKKIGRKIKDDYMDFANAVNEALETSMQYMDEWMDKRIEMAEVAVEAAQKETESAKTALDYEMQARANGYANNVELARKEYEQKLQMERDAIAERKRLEKIQEGINTDQQIGALVTATANLWSGYSKIPFAGPALAIAATALMWSSFFAAKIQAAQLANAETHGHGMAEYIDYGGSHASHNDVDFGRTKDGRRRRVEKGEVVGVVRKDKVQKYGVNTVMNIINNLNNGTFEKNYVSSTELVNSVMGESPESRANSAFLSAKVEDMLRSAESRSIGLKTGNTGIFDAGQLEANYEMAFNGASTDLSGVEQGIETLIEQNKVRVVSTPWGRIEYKGNNKRIIRNG